MKRFGLTPILILLTLVTIPLGSIAGQKAVVTGKVEEFQAIERLKDKSLSRVDFTRAGKKIEVFLFAENETSNVLTVPYCGGDVGAAEYSGTYQLLSVIDGQVISRVTLGDYSFTAGQLHNGLRKFKVPNADEKLVIFYQYWSCSSEIVTFYRVDDGGVIHKVEFLRIDGSRRDKESTLPKGVLVTEKEGNAYTVFSNYSNVTGKYSNRAYEYNGQNFVQKVAWEGDDLPTAIPSQPSITVTSKIYADEEMGEQTLNKLPDEPSDTEAEELECKTVLKLNWGTGDNEVGYFSSVEEGLDVNSK